MAVHVLTDQKLFVGATDLTTNTNSIALEYAVEVKDKTVYGNDTRIMAGGLKTVQLQAAGFYEATEVDDPMFSNVGVADTPITIFAQGSTAGDVAYAFKSVQGSYSFGESVGECLKYNLAAGARGSLIRGQVLNDSTETTTGDGTAVQVGAATSGQTVYAILHVTDSSGSGDQTLDVTIESDDNSGFTSGTNRFTFTQATTAATSEFLTLAGPITDDWWRINFVIAGTGSPSFDITVTLGVL